ncbi:FMN-dependent oxidoreductase, nitrilotriacetate monooxygenase family [Arboricoccus pini]|uniref:FMN-dependent oxidoreductase, nitrilotriacetate monooxygenase family n=1 Tax=Arboricoccus pini TaxID=1963835 RepID=A0A212PZ05_9PROT|nr:NtaA/DmoA family FMN-dependent monooxygenase [Arboricoccus pini]SNB52250.1 FMN-dependent oxidoreductase, nitrilotriacetate monooxygenase family [Arboricoccus pini]
MTRRQMHLGAFLFNLGNHVAGWRHPSVDPRDLMRLDFYAGLADIAERGLFDFVFLSDGLGLNDTHDAVLRHSIVVRPEPLTLLGALAARTRHIGLAATVSTTYNEPYAVARKLATLDFLSEGRVAVNIVTSSTWQEARNFGAEAHMAHDARYRRAAEFVRVMEALWLSWGPDAVLADQASGDFARPDQIRPIEHNGEFFAVRGPLNVPRPPQGRPVVIQAGISPAGQDLAAHLADVVFTLNEGLADATARSLALKAAARAAGRDPAMLKVMPGIMPILGDTAAEAAANEAMLEELVPPPLAMAYLSDMVGQDLTNHDPAGRLPDLRGGEGERGRLAMVEKLAREGLSLGGIARRMVLARGHKLVRGTPSQVADTLQLWFESGACDGFNILAPWHPGGLQAFVTGVVPELQRRGLFRRAYGTGNLRDRLGLPVVT